MKKRAEYEKYRDEVIAKSMPIRCEKRWHLCAALQMQFSVRLLYDFETDASDRARAGGERAELLKTDPERRKPRVLSSARFRKRCPLTLPRRRSGRERARRASFGHGRN